MLTGDRCRGVRCVNLALLAGEPTTGTSGLAAVMSWATPVTPAVVRDDGRGHEGQLESVYECVSVWPHEVSLSMRLKPASR